MTDNSRSTADTNLVWQLTGRGFDKLGLFRMPKPSITDDQLLVRHEVVTICFSSVKVILSGNTHPRLRGRDLERAPIVLGDEAFVVVEAVGRNLKGRFQKGQGCAINPELGAKTFGYGADGGLKRYSMLEGCTLDYLLPVEGEIVDNVGMFALSLSEPLGCVGKSYHLAYRRGLKENGAMLVMAAGEAEVEQSTLFQRELSREIAAKRPRKIAAANLTSELGNVLRRGAEQFDVEFICIDGLEAIRTTTEMEIENGFDDIVLLCGSGSEVISQTACEGTDLLAQSGILNLVGDVPTGTSIPLDIGRTHYEGTLVVGTTRTDFLKAYQANTNYELRAGGVAVFIGAGGPIGQLHLLRAMSMESPPAKLIAVEVEPTRLKKLNQWRGYAPDGTELLVMNPETQDIANRLEGDLIDYLVLLSPAAQVIEDYVPYLAPNAVVNAFAGLKEQHITLDADLICRKHLRVVGQSGADLASQRLALEKIAHGRIAVNPAVSVVGGMNAAWDALCATYKSTYPGKIVLYLGVDLPLTPIEAITGGYPWSAEYERELLRKSEI